MSVNEYVLRGSRKFERVSRIELPSTPWKGVILPLNYTRTALVVNGIAKQTFALLKLFREKTDVLPLNYTRNNWHFSFFESQLQTQMGWKTKISRAIMPQC